MTSTIAIAWHKVAHERGRTALALAGIGFALIVIFMQLGFRQAVEQTAMIVLGRLDFDILIRPRNYLFLADPGGFHIDRLRTAGSVAGVEGATPVYVHLGLWRSLSKQPPPREGLALWPWRETGSDEASWKPRTILVLGCYPSRPIFQGRIPGRGDGGAERELEGYRTLLIDRRSRPEFGPQDRGTNVEINNEAFRIAGDFEMGTGFASDGAALLDHHNYAIAFGGEALDHPALGLIKVADGLSVDEVADRLRARLPVDGESGDVEILTRDEVEGRETRFWLNDRTIGILFTMGVGIASAVGFVVFYQIFSSDITDHLPEYATLKAIGYSNGQVSAIVLVQAMLLGLIGYAMALALASGLYDVVRAATQMPMTIWDPLVLGIPLALGLGIASGSALFAIRKVRAANPADLFR